MNLRTKLLAGYLIFIAALVVLGGWSAWRLRTTLMRDNEGRLVGAVTLLEDITHLSEIDRIKSEFIATASHELRTPLTSVQMGVYLLLEGAVGDLTDKQTEVLAACREDCDRLRAETDDAGNPAPRRRRRARQTVRHNYPTEER
jgi:signal transduction histidine kinase